MEEKKDEQKKEDVQKEVKLLTFDPTMMQNEIKQLTERVFKLEKELTFSKKESLKFLLQNVLMELFGGHYISEEETLYEKEKKKNK